MALTRPTTSLEAMSEPCPRGTSLIARVCGRSRYVDRRLLAAGGIRDDEVVPTPRAAVTPTLLIGAWADGVDVDSEGLDESELSPFVFDCFGLMP